ncbi:unnamed protein product [Fraxinus pennsylvanica]|uniref:DNA mismatch repair protein MLH3 n=1 Tax=Fraxinus pennsylvanica TaxID=56036 RepID=A0AAD1YWB6_9LAMI|nr:unnamed protein product [Fraxinus pennsylvanica]
MRRIERLPEAIHSSVRSGIVICDLTRIVEELVFNSLEAGATKDLVSLFYCSIRLVDNGSGITRDGLLLLGVQYATSKIDHLAVMDGTGSFQGEALGSISDVSLLEIVTKARGMPNGYRKVMKGCKCLHLGTHDERHDVGTTEKQIGYLYPFVVKKVLQTSQYPHHNPLCQADHEYRKPRSRNQDTMSATDNKRSSRSSYSAPPFYRGKKRFLALSVSSTMVSEKINSQTSCGYFFLPDCKLQKKDKTHECLQYEVWNFEINWNSGFWEKWRNDSLNTGWRLIT